MCDVGEKGSAKEASPAESRQSRWRFGLRSCFGLQLLLVPVLLGPALHRTLDAPPHVFTTTLLLATTCYTAIFAYLAAARAARCHVSSSRTMIIAAVRHGAMFGAIFGFGVFLVLLSLVSYEHIAKVRPILPPGAAMDGTTWWNLFSATSFFTAMGAFFGTLAGMSVGALVGVAVGLVSRRRKTSLDRSTSSLP